ncbi:MAG: hypothetical protein K0U98_11355 [Deltaproteobacteria bacterium]|nr:hypothetical protein [Deltaproteobacteria bacterium]
MFDAEVIGAKQFGAALDEAFTDAIEFAKEETANAILDAWEYIKKHWYESGAFEIDTGYSLAAFGVALGVPFSELPATARGEDVHPSLTLEDIRNVLNTFDPHAPEIIYLSNAIQGEGDKPGYPFYLEEGVNDEEREIVRPGAHVVAAAAERVAA